mmetsp:Transcript_8365/g.13987  ORF Transcript_8365/g.13987 Transcript_8365/m.13987 type:complete len:418 (+) Transcript_8365:528-1781(+)
MELVEDYVDEIEKICMNDSDLSTKRNAFLLLFHIDQAKALNYLKALMAASEDDPIYEMGDIFQLSILEMLRKLIKVEPNQKQRLMSAIFVLSNSKSSSVLLECADTIVQLTTAPSAIKIAIQSYISLIQEQNDNNVKLIVIEKLISLKKRYSTLMSNLSSSHNSSNISDKSVGIQEYMSDLLNIINEDSVQSIEINQKVLELVTSLANSKNIKEVATFLEKEIRKARKLEDQDKQVKDSSLAGSGGTGQQLGQHTSTNEYRLILIKSVRQITSLFPEVIPQLMMALMESFLKFEKKGSMASLETIIFVREVFEAHPEHQKALLQHLFNSIDSIKNHLVLRVTIWIVGEYSEQLSDIDQAFEAIKRNIGSLPIFEPSQKVSKGDQPAGQDSKPKQITKTVILPDGSYGTETIMVDDQA